MRPHTPLLLSAALLAALTTGCTSWPESSSDDQSLNDMDRSTSPNSTTRDTSPPPHYDTSTNPNQSTSP